MTDQERREQVVKGLECCTMPVEKCQKICPYQGKSINSGDNTGFCETVLMLDALALLKAQEPLMILHKTFDIDGAGGNCPKCGSLIIQHYNPYFCGQCGQAVKWE